MVSCLHYGDMLVVYFIALVMKQLFIAAVTQMCVTLWGHGHLLVLWVVNYRISKELFAAAVAHIWVTL